jgi:probable F420-dependent oxidoreductase
MDLNGIGIYSTELRFGDPDEASGAAGELERLGFTGLWIPGAFGGDIFPRASAALAATEHVPVATGIVNIWAHTPEEVTFEHARITTEHPGRFLLGLGASHAEFVNALSLGDYAKPLAKMRGYLDALDASNPPVARGERVLAALRPRMRALAVERTAGIHSYFVPTEHTRRVRQEIGAGAVIAVEHAVVLESDPVEARRIARQYTGVYLTLPNYTNNLRELGYRDEEFADGGSDRLIDDLVAWGEPEQIRERLAAHLSAGADHVCAQVITPVWDAQKIVAGQDVHPPVERWSELAQAVIGVAGGS